MSLKCNTQVFAYGAQGISCINFTQVYNYFIILFIDRSEYRLLQDSL